MIHITAAASAVCIKTQQFRWLQDHQDQLKDDQKDDGQCLHHPHGGHHDAFFLTPCVWHQLGQNTEQADSVRK